MSASAELVQRQLDAYNTQNIEAFLACYDEDAVLAGLNGDITHRGLAAIRKRHEDLFYEFPKNHAKLANRIDLGTTVIDHELVERSPGGDKFEVAAIYTIRGGKIVRVDFARAGGCVMAALPEARFSIITLGVRDLSGMIRFYTDVLGLEDRGVKGEVAFFNMGGVVLGLWDETKLADDAGVADDRSGKFKGFALAYCARSEAEVDGIFSALKAHGATVSKAPHKTYWGGYSGYFADPEGNAWEVAYNPFWPIDSAGHVTVPAKEQ